MGGTCSGFICRFTTSTDDGCMCTCYDDTAAFFVFVSFSVAATAGLLQCILSKIFSAAVHATVFLCYFSYFFH